jgi:7-keto-8-aminopelargonate synthetase-like enzyme
VGPPLKEENIIFDKELENASLARFISANFSTVKSSKHEPLNTDHLENLLSDKDTSASTEFIRKVKKIIRKLEG